MLFSDIVKNVNKKLAGEQLTMREMLPFLDDAIDAINTKLNAKYPSFTAYTGLLGATAYDCFPDKYIRSVVIPYAVWEYYVADEEGLQAAQQFQADANTGLFYMQRDMLYNIPEIYQAPEECGSIIGQDSSDVFGFRGLIADLDDIPYGGHGTRVQTQGSSTEAEEDRGDFYDLVTQALNEHEERLDGHDDAISTLNGSVETINTELVSVEANIIDLTNRASLLEQGLTEADAYITEHGLRLDTLEEHVSDAETNIVTLQGNVASLATRATNVEARATTLETRATALETRATSLESNVSSLQSDVTSLDGRLTTAETLLVTHTNSISTLSNTADNHESRISSCENDIDSINGTIDVIEQNITDIDAALAEHLESIETLQSEFGSLNTTVSEHATAISTNTAAIATNTAAITANASAIAAATTKVSAVLTAGDNIALDSDTADKLNGLVVVDIVATAEDEVAAGDTIATLPAGFIPANSFDVIDTNNNYTLTIDSNDGVITCATALATGDSVKAHIVYFV